MVPPLLVSLFMFLAATRHLVVTSSDCPLNLSWSNFTVAAVVCSNANERGKCCRYISSFVAVSIARYAHATGQLGVPSAFSDMCIDSVSKTLKMYGIPPDATMFCGLGTKILVNYQCKGRTTVLEMLQSPNFIDVLNNCKMPLSIGSSCKRCLNSGILYLHHLIGSEDNVTLSTCRNAAFVSLINQGDQDSIIDMATCFFGVEGLGIPLGNVSAAIPPIQSPVTHSPVLAKPPTQHFLGGFVKETHHHYRPTLFQSVGIGVTGLSVAVLVIFLILIRWKHQDLKNVSVPITTSREAFPSPNQKFKEEMQFKGPQYVFKRFSYNDIKKATCNFSSAIGKGGFGTIFKAQFSDNSMAAVKRLDRVSEQGEEDFCREMELIGRLHHRHLVSLKGFCIEKNERFLVYEYMENGSLKDHLHSSGRTPLSWDARIQIAVDIANALEYLHFYCDPPLCHRDIKSSNILLDENFLAKVADFGLAHASRCGSVSFEPVNTHIRGTPGYMDPEYMITQELTEKSDIYSYGVLLLELVTGRRAIHDNKNIVEWSQKFMASDSTLPELVDPSIADSFDMEQMCVVSWIIRWCTQREGRARPSIRQVLRMLHEKLDPVCNEFAEPVDNEGNYVGLRLKKGKFHCGDLLPHSGDARCLMSSSSTTRSYCSRSFLLESGSPQSPHANFSG